MFVCSLLLLQFFVWSSFENLPCCWYCVMTNTYASARQKILSQNATIGLATENQHTYLHTFSLLLCAHVFMAGERFFSKFILIRIIVNNFCILFFSKFLCLLSNRKRPLALFNRFLISSSHQMLFIWRCYPLNTLIFIVICIAVALFCWK